MRIRSLLAAVFGCVLLTSVIAPAAYADDDYPSWSDVQSAKDDQAATASEATKISSLLDGLQTRADELGEAAVKRAAAYSEAQQKLDEATARADRLESERQEAAEKAKGMRESLDQTVGYFYRVQSRGSSLKMVVQGDASDDFLYRLSALSRLTESTSSQYEAAAEQENLVRSLSTQADDARRARDRLADEAETAAAKSKAASQRADAELAEQQDRSTELYKQLAYLKDTTAETEREYREGVHARRAYREQQEAAEEAARKKDEQKDDSGGHTEPAGSQTSGGGSSGDGSGSKGQGGSGSGGDSSGSGSGGSGSGGSGSKGDSGGSSDSSGSSGNSSGSDKSDDKGDDSGSDSGPETAPPPSGIVVDPGAAQSYARGRLDSYGWGSSQFSCLVKLWNRESSWRTDAYNPWSGAYGIAQALPGSKMSSAGGDWRTNAKTQINWGLGYIQGRYGSPCAAWGHSEETGWY